MLLIFYIYIYIYIYMYFLEQAGLNTIVGQLITCSQCLFKSSKIRTGTVVIIRWSVR